MTSSRPVSRPDAKQEVDKYTSRTSLHGIACVFARNYTLWRSMLWGVIFVTCVVMFLMIVISQIKSYFAFHTATKVYTHEQRPLEFPAVTICNLNLYRKSIVTESTRNADAMKILHPIIPDVFDPEAVDISKLNGVNWKGIYEESAHTLEETIDTALFMQLNVSLNFTYTMTHIGRCFTFNSADSQERFLSYRAGASFGLELRLDIDYDEYYAGIDSSAGLKILVHDPTVYPVMDEVGFVVAPGTQVQASVTAEEKIELPPPYSGAICREDKDLKKLRHFTHYSVEACYEECLIEFIHKECGCLYLFSTYTDLYRVCSAKQYATCVFTATTDYYTNSSDMTTCQSECTPPCKTKKYITRISTSQFPSQYVMNQLINSLEYVDVELSHQIIRQNYLQISIYYESLSILKSDASPGYTLWNLWGDIGGLMGLCMGASLMTMVEFAEFLVLVVVRLLTSNKIHNKTTVVHVQEKY